MKKTITTVLAVVMVFAMMTMFTGCGNDNSTLIGTWKADVNLASTVNKNLGDLGEMAEYLTLENFNVTMVLTFKSDDTFHMTIDEASVETAFSGLMEDLEAGVMRMMEDELAELGLDMTVEEMLAASGMSIDSLMEEAFAALDQEELIKSVVEESTSEGKFLAKDGKLCMSAGLEYNVDPACYEVYTLQDDTLTLVENVGDDTMDLTDMYPLVFKKAA